MNSVSEISSDGFDFNLNSGHCSYYSIGEYCDLLSNYDQNLNLSLINYNIRSFHANKDPFLGLLSSFPKTPEFIILTETWNTKFNVQLCSIDNFVNFHTYRESPLLTQPRGGGVSIFCRNNFSCSKIHELSKCTENIESCVVKISFKSRFMIVVGLYRPPTGSKDQFIFSIEDILNSELIKGSDLILIAGDMNLNILLSNCPLVTRYKTLLQSYRLIPVISKPTRFSNNSDNSIMPTLLDHTWFNSLSNYTSGIIDFDLTDHCPTFLNFNYLSENENNSSKFVKIKFRLKNEESISKFARNIDSMDWETIFREESLNEMFEKFIQKLDEFYRNSFPLKVKNISIKRLNKPWLDRAILRLIKTKSYYFKLCRLGIISKQVNNSFKNKVNKSIELAKNNYFKSAFERINNDMKLGWRFMNNLMNRNTTKFEVKKLIINGMSFETDSDIAEKFNLFFTKIAENLNNALPSSNISPTSYLSNSSPIQPTLELLPISSLDCENLIASVKNTKSGLDSLPTDILKKFKNEISKPLSKLINLSLSHSIFPNVLKLARITPIYKKGEDTNPSNYRPISCLPTFSKILEKHVVNQLRMFCKKNSIISNSQYGFQKNISTHDALVRLTEYLYNGLDDKMHNLSVLIDLTKAFDTVNIHTLLLKLQHFGIRGNPLRWFESYLQGRTQYVSIRGSNSPIVPLSSCGLPQGSVISPALFLFYINDLPTAIPNSHVTLFADDTTISFSQKTVNFLNNQCNENLTILQDWCLSNRLTINISKTELFTVSNRALSPGEVAVTLGGSQLDVKSSCKFLGVTLDSKLTFGCHTDEVSNKISIYIGILYKIRNQLNTAAKMSFYYGLIYPSLNYNIIVWGGAYATHFENLIKLQKRAIRIIAGASFNQSTTPLFLKFNILKFVDIYKYNVGIYMFKQIEAGNFRTQHGLNTRNRNLAVPQFHRLSTTQHSITFQGPKFWNALPDSLKNLGKLPKFKIELKKYLVGLYSNSDLPREFN